MNACSPSLILTAALAAALAGCGGATLRPSDDHGGVAPAPSVAPDAPVADPDPAPIPAPAPEAPNAVVTPDAPQDTAEAAASEIEIRRIGRWVSSNIRGARRLVIREPATWAHFWSELGAGVRPEVDFSRDLIIAVASGERATGGHDIFVQRVTKAGGDLRITVVETSPGPTCMTTTALTQPVDVVMVPSAGVTGWSFRDSTATAAC